MIEDSTDTRNGRFHRLESARNRRFHIIRGRVPTALNALADASCAALITDPPYCSGGASFVEKMRTTSEKYARWEDAEQARRIEFGGDAMPDWLYRKFTTEWLQEAGRAVGSGWGFVFVDWRMLPALEEAACYAGHIPVDVLVWDKGKGRPRPGRWGAHHEFILQLQIGAGEAQAPPKDAWYGGSNILRYPSVHAKHRVHLTQKPVELLRELVRCVRVPGPILDPFAGSGSTIAAALQEGRPAIGVEAKPEFVDTAMTALRGAEHDTTLGSAPLTLRPPAPRDPPPELLPLAAW